MSSERDIEARIADWYANLTEAWRLVEGEWACSDADTDYFLARPRELMLEMASICHALIDEDTPWNQAAYDRLTGVWRRVIGPIHPHDPELR